MSIEHDPQFNQPESLFKPFEQVKVKRTSGEIEDDWEFIAIEPNSGKAIVTKKEGDSVLKKIIDVDELKSWQQDTESEQLQTSEKSIEDKNEQVDNIRKIKLKIKGLQRKIIFERVSGKDVSAFNVDLNGQISELLSLESGQKNIQFSPEEIQEKDTELRHEYLISSVDNFKSLRNVIKDNQIEITSSSGHIYSTNELLSLIDQVRYNQLDITYITRKQGLRNKVQEILELDKVRVEMKKIKEKYRR